MGCQEAKTADRSAPVLAPPAAQSVSAAEAKALLHQRPGVILLDVRTPEEYKEGHLQQALHLDVKAPEFVQKVKQLDPGKTYLVYCAVGGRSSKASTLMAELGFPSIYNAKVGFDDLKEAGIPAE
jgi:phage shock protein E